jgi:hypothetical protein
MLDIEDVAEANVGLIFFIWMLMPAMIKMVLYISQLHEISRRIIGTMVIDGFSALSILTI